MGIAGNCSGGYGIVVAWSGWSLTCMLRDVALRVLVATSKSANVFGAMCRIRLGLDVFFKAANTDHNGWLTGRAGPQRGLDG